MILIDKELQRWQEWFERDCNGHDDPNFPFDEFHEKGVALAKKLAQAVKNTGVEIYYDRPRKDPKGRNSKPFKVE